MSRLFAAFTFLILLTSCSEESLRRTMETVNRSLEENPSQLTRNEVTAGLKEALVVGTKDAVDISSRLNGFYQNPDLYIAFPPEAKKVKETALDLGLSKQVEQFEETLNHAAEEAVKQAQPIFIEAITDMTIEDAFAILKGGEHAATDYLRQKTETSLLEAFRPKVQEAIDKVEVTRYWNPLISAYNTASVFTGSDEINPNLTSYVNEKAVDGLFLLIAREEEDIRKNPAARISDLLRKVFGSAEANAR